MVSIQHCPLSANTDAKTSCPDSGATWLVLPESGRGKVPAGGALLLVFTWRLWWSQMTRLKWTLFLSPNQSSHSCGHQQWSAPWFSQFCVCYKFSCCGLCLEIKMEVTWLVMRAHSPGLQPPLGIQQDLLFPFCPDYIWAVGQVGIPWHIGTPLSVLDFLKTSVVLRVMVRWGMSWVCVLPAGVVGRRLLQGVCCSAVAAVSASPCPFRSALSFTLPLELISSAL